VIISFDDGYYDFLEYAVPILRKHDIRANMNIIASRVKTGAPPLNIQLVDFLNESPKSLIDEIKIPGFNVRLKTDSEVDKIKFGLQISGFFKNRPRKDFLELWASLMPVMSKVDISNATRMLDFDQVKEVAGTHEIGAHSYSHQSMEFESDQFFEQDFLDCKKFMDEELGLSCYIYAFPNGSHRESQINSLREWGGGGFCVAY
jgi:peptidoglycan/xylan/chitin deacetylase (PgdA/CDA1 family)